jgi:hypothetical protein
MKPGRVSREEWKWLAAWSLVFLLLTGLPYLLGAYLETPESAFSGFFVAVEDGNTYLAVMRQGAAGRWAFTIPFTPEPHAPGYVFIIYLLLGKMARTLGLSLPLTMHLAKLVTTPLLLASVYRFGAHFTAWRFVRRLSFFLVAAGGGLGWLWVLAGQPFAPGVMPTDLWVPDASTFLTMLTFPHLAIAQSLILWVAVCGLQLLRRPDWRWALLIGVLGLVLSLVHPYSLPVVLGLLGLCWLQQAWRARRIAWKPLVQLAAAGALAAPYLIYSVVLFWYNPVFRSWQDQNRIWSPPAIHYLLGFGLLCPLALVGLLCRRPLRRWSDYALPALWVVLIPVGLYVPSNLQRRFLDGYQAPLTLVAVAGLLAVLHYVRRGWRHRCVPYFGRRSRVILPLRGNSHLPGRNRCNRVVLVVGTVSMLSNVLLLIGFTLLVAGRPPAVFNPRAELDAMDWLAAHSPPDSVVLAAYDTGNLLPTRALVRSFVGHGPQSVNADAKQSLVRAFYGDAMTDGERVRLLETYRVAYVFYGPAERVLGGFSPANLPGLRRVYADDVVQIFQVGGGGGP